MPVQRAQAKVNHHDLPLIGAAPRAAQGQPTINPDEAGWILPLIGRAIDRTMHRKEAAFLMGIDAGQLSRQLSADGHLSTLRLGALGREFWLMLADEVREHFGRITRDQLLEEAEQHLAMYRRLMQRASGL